MELLRFVTFRDERGYDLAAKPARSNAIDVKGSLLDTLAHDLSVVARGGQKIPLILQGIQNCIFEKIANTPPNAEGALDLVSEWGFPLLVDDEMPAQRIANLVIEFRHVVELAAANKMEEIEALIPSKKFADIGVMFERFGKDRSPRLYLRPKSLIHFAWIELLCAISSNAGFKKCTCGNIFTYNLEKGSRNTKLYCSNRCRVANHRAIRNSSK